MPPIVQNMMIALILKETDPRAFLIMGGWMLLVGLSVLVLAVYLAFKRPEEIKRHRWLRRFSDSDWGQYLAGGLFFTSLSVLMILSSLNRLGREMGEFEGRLAFALVVIAFLSVLSLIVLKMFSKSDD